jgi:hypothetical protein
MLQQRRQEGGPGGVQFFKQRQHELAAVLAAHEVIGVLDAAGDGVAAGHGQTVMVGGEGADFVEGKFGVDGHERGSGKIGGMGGFYHRNAPALPRM